MDNVVNISEVDDFLNIIYDENNSKVVKDVLSLLNNNFNYININNDILDYIYTQEEYTNRCIASNINLSIKDVILDLYNNQGFNVNHEENYELSLNKHLDIIKSITLLDGIDICNVFIISEIIHNDDLDNIEKIYNIFTILNIMDITINEFLNLFMDIHSKFINNIITIIDKVTIDVVNINDNMYSIDELKNQSAMVSFITDYLNNLHINKIDTDIINILILPISKDLTSAIMDKKYINKIKLFNDMDESIKRNIIITYLIITLLLENFNDNENYLNITKLKLVDSGLSVDLINSTDAYFSENNIYDYIRRVNND